jgi:anti-sigma factor RsiW
MTHEQIQDREIVDQYVRHKLPPADRQAFQEHYFSCDECFEQVQMTARFAAGVRDAARSGVLAGDGRARVGRILSPAAFYPNWLRSWAIPALATSFLLAAVLLGVWALSMRRENQQLAQQVAEQKRAAEQLRSLETKVRELEASDSASQKEKQSLSQEIDRLKTQLAETGRERAPQVAELRPPDVPAPLINIYPTGDIQRSPGAGQSNRINLPPGSTRFVLILSDFQTGARTYRVEVSDSSGRVIARRAGLKPDRSGELSLPLNRSGFNPGKYTVKLFGQDKAIAEYIVEIE